MKSRVTNAMAQSAESFGRLDGCFANAGRGGSGKAFIDLTLEDWRAVMAVNLDGVFLTLREAARVLIEQGEGGSLVAVSSTSAIHGAAGNEAYGTAKTGLNGLVRALAVGLARYRIRVNSLLPGWTRTELAKGGYENDRFRDRHHSANPGAPLGGARRVQGSGRLSRRPRHQLPHRPGGLCRRRLYGFLVTAA